MIWKYPRKTTPSLEKNINLIPRVQFKIVICCIKADILNMEFDDRGAASITLQSNEFDSNLCNYIK